MAVKWALYRKAEEFGDCIAECGVRKKKGRKKKKKERKMIFLIYGLMFRVLSIEEGWETSCPRAV